MRLPLAGLRPIDASVDVVTRKGRTLSPGAALLIDRLAPPHLKYATGLRLAGVTLHSAPAYARQ